jgi:hypothetical protein
MLIAEMPPGEAITLIRRRKPWRWRCVPSPRLPAGWPLWPVAGSPKTCVGARTAAASALAAPPPPPRPRRTGIAPSPEKRTGEAGAACPSAASAPDDRHDGANPLGRHVAAVRRQHQLRTGNHRVISTLRRSRQQDGGRPVRTQKHQV